MAHLQPGTSGGHLPVHAFYIPPQAAHATPATLSIAHKATMNAKQKLVFATPTATRLFRAIQTAALLPTHAQHSRGYSALVSASSSMPSPTVAMLPPSINPPPYDSSFDNDKSASTSDNGNNVPWLAPLLGVLGAMGVIIIAIIYFVRRRRYKSSSRSVAPNDHRRNPRNPQPITANKHSSWASLSTINTSAGAGVVNNMSGEEKTSIHMLQPPPAYSKTTITTTKTSVQQKRLTADTLVDEPSLSMLKSQYSPQLAFSPSLVAGEFQQQLDHPPLPNTATLSPSNTLIDNAGVLSNEKNQNYYSHDAQQQRIKIEMYDPQVNLHNAGMDGEDDDEDDDGFETPYNKNYPHHQEERVNAAASEGDKHIAAAVDATAATEHQIINMSNTNKQ